MSELMNARYENREIRWQLLATVSASALIAAVYTIDAAIAHEDDTPTVWIELGGQLEKVSNGQELFAPPFILRAPRPPAEGASPLGFENMPRYSKGMEGKLTFFPHDSDWSVTAAVRYGRSNNQKHVHQQSYPKPFSKYLGGYQSFRFPMAAKFSDIIAKNAEQHLIVDFQVGKDVGLGMFGRSTINVGVRFAQFTAKSNITMRSDPDWHFHYKYINYPGFPTKFVSGQIYHSNFGQLSASRSFHGIGPSLSWNGSSPVAGNPDATQVLFDWGVNAALLFGRQKTKTHHQTTGRYHQASGIYTVHPTNLLITYHNPATPDHVRSRSLVVPNIGGFAGVSFKYVNAKISLGYRADFFFGATDGGIDTHKTYDRNFYGPFATISIGLGG